MMEYFEVRVQTPAGAIEPARLWVAQQPPWRLVFSGAGLDREEFCGVDLFEAMTSLREQVEPREFRILCAGARRDVFPSGMSRSMGGGRQAYVLKPGRPAARSTLVDIFTPATAEEVGTVSEQRRFFERWQASFTEK